MNQTKSSVMERLRHRIWSGANFDRHIEFTDDCSYEVSYDELISIFGDEPYANVDERTQFVTWNVQFDDGADIRIIGSTHSNYFRIRATSELGIVRVKQLVEMHRTGELEQKIDMCADENLCWVPAEGGMAHPFTVSNVTYRSMWNPLTDERAYYNITDDCFVGDEITQRKLTKIEASNKKLKR